MGPRFIKPDAYCLKCLSFTCEHFRPGQPYPQAPHFRAQQVAIVRGIAAGKANKQIAYEIGMSYASTKAYVGQILRLLGVESRLQVALWAHAHQLTETGETKA